MPEPNADTVAHRETLGGGESWSFRLQRGFALRLTDLEGGANVALLAFNAAEPLERYNMPDTLKAQHTFRLTRGHCLYSDMGHSLLSIIDDSLGWHDTVCGVADAQAVAAKYGVGRYQELRNDFHRNGYDRFLIELSKHGLGKRDLVANVNFFSKVTADGEGKIRFVPGHSGPGAHVDLRADMNVLLVLHTCPHPLDPSPDYAPKSVELTVWRCGLPAADDLCRGSRPENARGLENTRRCFCQQDWLASHADA